jgi:hypothetical protein
MPKLCCGYKFGGVYPPRPNEPAPVSLCFSACFAAKGTLRPPAPQKERKKRKEKAVNLHYNNFRKF